MKTKKLIQILPTIRIYALVAIYFVLAEARSQTLTCGQVVSNTFTSAGQIVTYTMNGNSGDVIRISSQGISGSVQPDVAVNNPSGTVAGGFGYNDGFSTLQLTNSGTFAVRVFDRSGTHIGNFSLSLVFTTPKCSAIALSCGLVLTNSFTSVVQQHTYSISAVAGETVNLTSISKTGSVQPDMDIFDPAGHYLGGGGYNDGANLFTMSTFTFTNTGSYLVIVRDRANSHTGDYTLGVAYTTPKCTAIPLSCGQLITNTVVDPAQRQTYSISALAGDVIRLTSVAKTGSILPDIYIYDPQGRYIRTVGTSDGISTFTFTNSGAYIVLVRDRANANLGSYSLGAIYSTLKCWLSDFSCNHSLSGTLLDPAQQDSYRLIGYAGEIVRITSSPTSGTVQPDVDVFNSLGLKIGGFGYNDTTSLLTLTNGGIYEVVVRDRGNAHTGSYSLNLVVPAGCPSLPSVSVAPINLAVPIGSSATFTATGSGPMPLYYQWWFGNAKISGATNAIFNIASVQTNNAGNYVVVVGNPGGSVTSSPPAMLTISSVPPTFTQSPVSLVINSGQSFTFTSLASGFPFPTYQWRFSTNGSTYVNIIGATDANYSLISSGLTNIGFYRVVIANLQGTNTSSVVTMGFIDLKMKMLANVYLTGPISSAYRIDAASQLAPTNWVAVTNITILTQPYVYVDYSSATNKMQFYRAVPQ